MAIRPVLVWMSFALAMGAAAAAMIYADRMTRGPLADVAPGTPVSALPLPAYVAFDAEMEIRLDERPSGLILKHQLLRLQKVSRADEFRLRGDTLLYTDAVELRSRIDDVLDGRVPVLNGLEAVFAVGRLAPATIVRLDSKGRVETVEEIRAAFVAFTIE